jgi:pilus assembly protein CpaF
MSAERASARERHIAEVAATLRGRLVERRRAEAAAGRRGAPDLEQTVRELVDEEAAILAPADRAEIAARIVRDSVGFGPLEILLADPLVEEVMVNGPDRVFVERAGRIEATPIGFADEEELRNAMSGSWRRSVGASTSSARWSTPASPTARGSTW